MVVIATVVDFLGGDCHDDVAVMRTQGSLRVILNTKIWSGMNVERASTKAIRITATDVDQAVRVFLIMVSLPPIPILHTDPHHGQSSFPFLHTDPHHGQSSFHSHPAH